jgi:hypothetical protein
MWWYMKKGSSSYLAAALVLLMMIYPVPSSTATSRKLSCHLEAWYDLMPRAIMPGKPDTGPILFVAGKCTVPNPGYWVELKRHIPLIPGSKTLLLDAIVHALDRSDLAVPQVVTDVPVRYELRTTPTLYEKVIILPDRLVLTVGKAY